MAHEVDFHGRSGGNDVFEFDVGMAIVERVSANLRAYWEGETPSEARVGVADYITLCYHRKQLTTRQ